MASSRNISHVRSFSWPSESSHTLDSSIKHLCHKLRESAEAPASSSASSICRNLCDIKDLYQAINNSIECPMNQQVLSLDQNRIGVEEALESSLTLLDACGSTKDILSLMKESIFKLESSLRRNSSVEEKDIGEYMRSRKKIQKMANKCHKNWLNVNMGIEKDGNQLVSIIRMSSNAQNISLSTLKSVIAYASSAKAKRFGLLLMAKWMQPKWVSQEREAEANEVEKIDQTLLALEAKKLIMNAEMVQTLLKQLNTLELAFQAIEECLERMSRCLLQTRVALLNVLSH